MIEIMPVPRILILLSYQQRAFGQGFFFLKVVTSKKTISIVIVCLVQLLYCIHYKGTTCDNGFIQRFSTEEYC